MRWVVGIDEVGRGALAGPVVVAAAAVMRPAEAAGASTLTPRRLGPLKDSKKLTPARRAQWFAHITAHPCVAFAVARVYPRGIERLNISAAANLAARRAYRRLARALVGAEHAIFLDGGLYLGTKRERRRDGFGGKTVVKADEKIAAVKIASIIAKVSRDRYMEKLGKRHPEYGFEVHKGYGTRAHQAALRRHGPS